MTTRDELAELLALRESGQLRQITPNPAQPPQAFTQGAANVIGGLASQIRDIPQKAIGAAQHYTDTGEYNPAPVMDAATLAMTGGIPFAQRGALGMAGGKLPAAKPGELAELGLYPTTTPGRIHGKTLGGGYSVNLPTGEIPSQGLMMGKYANTDPRNMVLSPEEFKRASVRQHAQTNAQALAQPEHYFGSWRDPASGKVYLDVSQRFPEDQIRQATKFGERTGQLSGWNLGAGQGFPVGNWREFVASPEFYGRMGEMSGKGRAYLNQHPTKEWWDMHGTPFERVYGEKNLPQVAGFSAATAPSSKPRENMQMMSEYMRRHLSGEPITQPDFRLPESAMGPRRPGMQMSMETGRSPNLEKAARGDLDALQRAKVREEAKAMMGDPNAVVLDRHWARLTEAPERGIYANAQEGVIDTNARIRQMGDYDFVKQHVSTAAKAANRSPRDYSADVWTGIRETIKNTSELYGTKYKGSAVQGESKSYADVFQDLVQQKAQHLGISVRELDKRLRSGDADLLSTMLVSSPVLSGAYLQWQQKEDEGSERSVSPENGGRASRAQYD